MCRQELTGLASSLEKTQDMRNQRETKGRLKAVAG